jgi:hypothetical protein
MAFTPCAFHGRGYAGGASTFFLRLVSGGDQRGGKLQVCPDCASVALEYLALHFQKVSEGETFFEYSEPLACANCGGDLGADPMPFYGNAYPRGKRETQWYGQVCSDCVGPVAEDLHLDAAKVRA